MVKKIDTKELISFRHENKMVVSISTDGNVTLGEGIEINEASAMFFEALSGFYTQYMDLNASETIIEPSNADLGDSTDSVREYIRSLVTYITELEHQLKTIHEQVYDADRERGK